MPSAAAPPQADGMIDSARRTVTELGMRHALLEVEQFAGIVELVADDPAAAEPHLRQAYNGFRRMGLDADTAETAALLAAHVWRSTGMPRPTNYARRVSVSPATR